MGKHPEFLRARPVDATYGVCAAIPFQEGMHENMYRTPSKIQGPKIDMCSNIFSTIIEVGTMVSFKDVYTMSYTPESQDQREMRVQIYSSPEKDVWYTTGKRPSHLAPNSTDWVVVDKIGELIVLFPEALECKDLEDQRVDITFDFSGSEINIKAYCCRSQTEFRVTLDFLDT